jgi:biotin transport system substrate-specific component
MKRRAMLHARVSTVSRATDVGWILAGSILMAASAQIALSVPFSPVPITGQTLALPLIVALLGTRAATLAMIAYLVEGASGLPVFAQHQGGAFWLLGAPTAGYLWAFPFAAFATGWLLDRGLRANVAGRFVAIFLGTAVVFVFGAGWLAHVAGGAGVALAAGVYPFVAGDLVKTALAAILAAPLARFGPRSTRL